MHNIVNLARIKTASMLGEKYLLERIEPVVIFNKLKLAKKFYIARFKTKETLPLLDNLEE